MSVTDEQQDQGYQLARNMADYNVIRKGDSRIKNAILDHSEQLTPATCTLNGQDDGEVWYKYVMERYRSLLKDYHELISIARHYKLFFGLITLQSSDNNLEDEVANQFIKNGFRKVAPTDDNK